jgi:tRNA pseudouridine55 synthase
VAERAAVTARHGVVVVDKPAGLTSSTAVEIARSRLAVERVGHGGTLDPIATGVLVLAVGAATKLAGFLLADDKGYVADAVLGAATDTLDRTGAVVAEQPWQHVDEAALRRALAARVGEHDQVPPMYSAIKVDGVRLHERARAGDDVPRAPRRVRIDALELVAWDPPRARITIACGKGTYVRSLVADLAADLGTVGHLAELRRTRAGRYAIDAAVALDALAPDTSLQPVETITGLPSVVVPEAELRHALHAVQLPADRLGPAVPSPCQLVDAAGRLVAIVHVDDRGRVIYDRVFPELFRG